MSRLRSGPEARDSRGALGEDLPVGGALLHATTKRTVDAPGSIKVDVSDSLVRLRPALPDPTSMDIWRLDSPRSEPDPSEMCVKSIALVPPVRVSRFE